MQHQSEIRTPIALSAAAQSLAVSASVARSGFTSCSYSLFKLVTGSYNNLVKPIGFVVSFMDGSRRECFKVSIRPDSFIPSRTAARITRYAIQRAKAAPVAPIAAKSKIAGPIRSISLVG
jgi:hypothetical protein